LAKFPVQKDCPEKKKVEEGVVRGMWLEWKDMKEGEVFIEGNGFREKDKVSLAIKKRNRKSTDHKKKCPQKEKERCAKRREKGGGKRKAGIGSKEGSNTSKIVGATQGKEGEGTY